MNGGEVTSELAAYAKVVWSENDLIEIRPLPAGMGKREWILAKDITHPDRVQRLIAENRVANIYAGVLPRIKEGGRAEDVEGGRVVWADFDHMTPEEAIERTGRQEFPPPSMAVNTGHGAHLFWKLDKWETKERICECVTRIIQAFDCDKSVKDPARILRLPGFTNHKPPIAESGIIFADHESPYSLDELLSFLPEVSTPVVQPAVNIKPWETQPSPTVTPVAPGAPVAPISQDDDTISRAKKYVASIEGSNEGGRTNTAFRVAAVLVNDYQLDNQQALTILTGWDLMSNNPPIQNDPKYGYPELQKIINNAVKYHKKDSGNKIVEEIDIPLPTVTVQEVEAPVHTPGIYSEKEFLKRMRPFLNAGGLLSQMCDYMDQGAWCLQPELSLGAALAFFGVVFGRLYKDEQGCRTNLYIFGTAPSGGGKNRALEAIQKILPISEMKNILGPSGFRSGSALIKTLSERPRILSLIDEAGLYLRGVNMAGKSNPHLAEIVKNLMEMYSCSNSVYTPQAAAGYSIDDIVQPCLGIYGCTVADSLYDKMPKENISNGFLARVLIINGRSNPKDQDGNSDYIPENLVSVLNEIQNKYVGQGILGGIAQDLNPTLINVPYGEGVAEYYRSMRKHARQLGRKVGEPLATLWTRAIEKGQRISLIHACCQNYLCPKVTLESAKWGCELSMLLTEYMIEEVKNNVAENDVERNHQKILQIIRDHRKPINKSLLTRKTQFLTGRVRDEIIYALIEGEQIESVIVEGKKKTYYRIKQ